MQARGLLPQQIYPREQIGCLRRKSTTADSSCGESAYFKSGRRGDTDSSMASSSTDEPGFKKLILLPASF
jgi:hypothetical protein